MLKKLPRKFLVLFIIFGLLEIYSPMKNNSSALGATPQELKDSITQKAEELKKINEQIQETQNNLEETKEEGKTLKKEITKVNSQINQINLGIKSSEILIEKLGLEIESTQYDISAVKEKIGVNNEAISKTLREIQMSDNETPLMIFLKNKNLAESVFEIQGLANLSNALAEEVGEMKILKNELEDKLKESNDKKKSHENENINLKNKKIISEDIKKEKQVVLNETKNQEKTYQRQLSELEKLQDEIGEEIDKLEEELRLKIDPALLPARRPGVLETPVQTPPAKYTSGYGWRNGILGRKRAWHNGVDFGAPIGTPILAAEKGEVIAVGDNDKFCRKGAYGKFIMVKHENNLTTLYAHLSGWNAKVGDKVERGEIIGYMGNTGRSTGSHLHLTVYATNTIPPAAPGFYEGTRSSRVCGPLPVGGDLNPSDYLNI